MTGSAIVKFASVAIRLLGSLFSVTGKTGMIRLFGVIGDKLTLGVLAFSLGWMTF